MSVKRALATGITVLTGLGISYVGLSYLLDPAATAPSFGLPDWPRGGDATGFLNVKGVRDLVSGLAVLTLLATRQRRALGWLMLVESLTPLGDMLVVLSHHGSAATAFGVHGLTAAAVATAGVLLLGEQHRRPEPAGAGADRPATAATA
ncbi:hypothetical protein GCM10010495_55170 [Kitasatospora herbaricolor]|uniref:DUF4267 domain-containing protein n=1 Tax=Kitasatospora herbaricolor TaxID=68217 RepID=UPI00174AD4AD|nr:DUF4267 domain-containing protein [Kitasatospora herbaricolor]MDQ0307252.1 hypothetical protein [Kitasatospora herbaricolor]GGV31504.1 hypothetical protein GCM10010495_55170 [Kitasatospora herbaricolor]